MDSTARASRKANAKAKAKAGRQRCHCSHQRAVHDYQPRGFGCHPKSRPCKAAGCSCPNFLLVQRSML